MIDYRKATKEDARYIGRNLKKDDAAELRAFFQAPMVELIQLAVETADKCYAIGPEGAPYCIFGVQVQDTTGYIWSLSTPEVLKHWRVLHREVPAILDQLGEGLQILTNIKDARQKHHIRWLRSLGFTFINTQLKGPFRLPFHQFVRIQK